MVKRCTATLSLCVPLLVHAQPDVRGDADAERKTARVERAQVPPVLDGILDETEWRGAGFVEDLEQVQPVEHAAPSERTEVYLLYDEEALYVGARLYDTEPKLITANVLRQNSWIVPDDAFYITLDPFNTGRAGYFFGTNPNGVRYDGTYRNVSEIYDNWDGIFDAAAGYFEGGWIAEFKIPFKTLSFDANTDGWGLNFSRTVARKNERIAWSSRNRSWDPSVSGLAIGFEGIQQGAGLDVVPSATYRRRRLFSPNASDSELEPSLDIFYKLTPSLNASLTLNTDFSATEVDDRQVNLTRFSLFFPEKRDFFLREEDIFDFGRIGARNGNGAIGAAERENGRPFFSRRIGLSVLGQPVDIDYGGKISGRAGRWEIGALSIREDEFASIHADTLSVVRIKANLAGESTIGAVVTNGSPTANADNSVAGLDYVYRNSRLPGGRTIEGFTWYQRSDTAGIDADDSAMGLGFAIPSTRGFRGGLAAKEFQRNFNPGLGFISRTDVRDYSGHIAYTHRPASGRWQSVYSGIEGQRIESIGGGLQSQLVRLTFASLTNQTGDSFSVRSNVQREVLESDFVISPAIAIPTGAYSFSDFGAELGTSRFRKVSGGVGIFTGDFYDGSRDQAFANVRWQPSPKLAIGLGYGVNYIELPSGDFETRLTTANFDLVFSSTLSWVNLLQYDNISDTIGLSSRLHWIPQAGREMYFVLNHTVEDFDLDDRFHSVASDVAAKINYTFRF